MGLQTTIESPQADIKAFWARLERASRELGKKMGPVLKMGGNALARSIGTSTRVAPKYRPVTRVRGERNSRGLPAFEVLDERTKKTFIVHAAGLREARKSRKATISRRGLAKATNQAIARQLGQGGAMGPAAPATSALARKFGHVQARLTGTDPYVRMENKLKYAVDALTGGPQAIDQALARATRAIDHIVDKQLTAMIGRGDFA